MTMHRQVTITHGEMIAKVDVGIAELISSCWRANVWTLFSCQEITPGRAWIMFTRVGELERFLAIVAHFGSPDLLLRMWKDTSTRREGKDWEYEMDLFPAIMLPPDSAPVLRCGIEFPVTDIPLVQSCLEKFSEDCYMVDRHGKVI